MPVIVQPQEPMGSSWFPHGEPITVINRTVSGRDAGGNDVLSESSPVVYVGAFDPAIGFESTTLQDQVSSQPQVFLPFDAVVTSTSVVLVRGDRYEVDGRPGYWRNPFTGSTPGVQVPLKRVTG